MAEVATLGIDRLQGRSRHVQMGGFLSKAEATNAILNEDWLLITSRIESNPVIFSDAMKLCCSLIAMPVGDLPGLLQDQNMDIIAERVNAQAYADAISTASTSSGIDRSVAHAKRTELCDLSTIFGGLAKSLGEGS